MNPSTRRGFTLVELLVTIGIIALLVGILLPALGKVQERAKATQTLGLMQEFAKACDSFQQEFGRYPGLVPEDVLADTPRWSSTENALLELMGGGVRKTDVDATLYAKLKDSGWTEITFPINTMPASATTEERTLRVAINPAKIGEGPLINGKRFPPFFAPKSSDLQVVAGAVYSDGTSQNIPTLVDAWGMPLLYLRSVRNSGLLAGNDHRPSNGVADRAQFIVVDQNDSGFGGLSPYLTSGGLGPLSVNQTRQGAADGNYSLLDQSNIATRKRTFAQLLRHPGFGEADKPQQASPRGRYLIVSPGKDGIYFNVQDGPGRKGSPVTDITTNVTNFGGLAALDNYDDIRVFGGG